MSQPCFSMVREFSQIGRLQKPHTICYAFYAEENQTWLELEKKEEGRCRKERFLLERGTRQAARELVQFLYENAIPMENWKDVAAEVQLI